MIDWFVIAGRLITGLVIFAVGLTLTNLAYGSITKLGTKKARFLGQTARIAIIILVSLIALEQIRSTISIVNIAYGKLQVANVLDYQKNVSLGQRNVFLGGGGYVTGIYLHPLQKDLVYIKTDVGGFYRWNPDEQSWQPLTDHFPLEQSNYYGGEALALDPNNPDIVYIAAGKFTADWWPDKGTMFKSTDKGETWTKLNIDLKMGGNEDLRWLGERLAVNPFNSNMILFGSRLDGLWKSLDAGATWSQVLSFPGKPKADIGITAIAFSKQVLGLVYAIAYGDGIYQSTDSGFTWSKIPGSSAEAKRLGLASNGVLYVTHSSGVSKYTNGAWSNITPFKTKDTFNAISVNPTNPNNLLVSLGENGQSSEIYQSLDGGTTWTKKKKSMNTTVPWWSSYMRSNPWIAAIEFDPQVTDRVWFTDWYGIWRTEDINANPVTWANYQQGHEEVVTFTLVSPPKGALLLSGVADVDGFYHDKGLDAYPSKTFGSSGPSFQDTYHIAYCETDPLKMVRVGGNRWNDTYTGTTSIDGGRTWKPFASFPEKRMLKRIAISATDPNIFIVTTGGGQPVVTTDGGKSWKNVSGLPDGSKGPWDWSQPLAADKVDGNTFYYYAEGKFYRSTDKGLSFETVNASLPNEWWHSLKTLPGVKGEVWLSLDWQGLYRSTDGGKTFSKLEKVNRAHLFAFGKPPNGSTIPALYLYGKIAGKGEGIFRSLDRGKTWDFIGDRQSPIGNNPNVMEASKQQFGLVFIGTNGRGIYYGSQ
ncbi:hypothetical protein [Allocoleopsis franciscana]|uniref:BNR/Asp-box repeat protein n=1 Tax=Allocoleopsis franciscana PCC 7113 TaxID=1173027 RepID=K9WJX4_9CYAN|nr:hypothetical protein [Allocoleopsis franciscana]AFZ19837.1 BNR/Asp-box repeat protein [Allocoleopsis franciscana PCC 7113]